MIDGCIAWQQSGLNAPETVIAATADYLEAQDATAAWIDECCNREPNGWESRTALFDSWTKWATTAGEYVGTRARLLDALEARGFEPHRQRSGTRGFNGLTIKREQADDPYWNR
jgi:putative DNA primase/helicase